MIDQSWPVARTVVVTGAASRRGIGRAAAHRMAEQGWAVAVLDLDQASCDAVATELTDGYGGQAIGVGVDIADEDAVRGAIDRVRQALPPVTGLLNIAGVSSPVPFGDLTTAEWDRVFAVNVRGTYFVTRAVVPMMLEAGVGRIVTVSSVSAERGGGIYGAVPYSASKAALLGFTRALARELGPHGITVNAIAPGSVDTDIMGGELSPERRAALTAPVPVGRLGTVADIAALLSFLAGPDAGYINGATVDINGGFHIA